MLSTGGWQRSSLAATGALTLFAGSPGDGWVFALHDALGVGIAMLLVFKLRRVWPRVRRVGRRSRLVRGVAGAAGPRARGFQWVKWVERLKLMQDPDYGAPASTLWSGFAAAGGDGG